MNLAVARTWAERAQAELGASRRFKVLATRLRTIDTPAQIIGLVEQAEIEEDEHAALCARMALDLGHETGFAHLENHHSEIQCSWHEHPDEADRLLLDLVLLGCITESINASLLRSIYTEARPGRPRDLIHKILADEVKHAQIGWAYLSLCCTQRDCRFVGDYLSQMLDLSVRDELFLPALSPMVDGSYDFGVMPVAHRLSQFCATLDKVVIPGFAHFGIDTTAMIQWRNQKMGA